MTTDAIEAPPAATCPRCGGRFACGVAGGLATPCFCASLELGAPRLAELRARWTGCLCAACLATLAADPERPA